MSHETTTSTTPPKPEATGYELLAEMYAQKMGIENTVDSKVASNDQPATTNEVPASTEPRLTPSGVTDEEAAEYREYRSELEEGIAAEQKLRDIRSIPGAQRSRSHLTPERLAEIAAIRKIRELKKGTLDHDFSQELTRIDELWKSLGSVAYEAAQNSVDDAPASLTDSEPINTPIEVTKSKARPIDEARDDSSYETGESFQMRLKNEGALDTPLSAFGKSDEEHQRDIDAAYEKRIETQNQVAEKLYDLASVFDFDDDKPENVVDALNSLTESLESDDSVETVARDNDVRPLGTLGLKAMKFVEYGKSTKAFYQKEKTRVARQFKSDRRQAVKERIAARGGEKAADYLSDKKLFRRVGLRLGAMLGNKDSRYELDKKKLKKSAQKQNAKR
jgi:hypothetical protein